MRGAAADESTGRPDRLTAAIEGYLTYLRVERGLADATLSAYRAYLLDFAASRGAAATWDSSAETPIHYLSMLGSPGRGHRAVLRPTSLRRRTASIRGFYRFCYAEGMIETDLAGRLDLPRQPRRPGSGHQHFPGPAPIQPLAANRQEERTAVFALSAP